MKLKKIAFLRLAGVMAVSMLTACGEGNTNPGEGEGEKPATIANDISAGVAANIEKLPAYVTFTGDAKLSDALDYVGEFVGVKDIVGSFINKVHVEEFGGDYHDAGTLQGRLEEAVGADKDITVETIGEFDTLRKAELKNSVSMDPATAVRLYAISGIIESNALNTLVAEEIQDEVKAYIYTLNKETSSGLFGQDTVQGIYNHSYAVSVSTSTKNVGENVVTLVAVQVVRTSVHH